MILLAHILGMPVEELMVPPVSAVVAGMLVGLGWIISGLQYRSTSTKSPPR